MVLADRLKRKLERARAIAGRKGLHPYRVFLRTGSWTGQFAGDGGQDTGEIELTENGQPPRVVDLDSEALALGELDKGSKRIGPITPEHSAGGTNIQDLLGRDRSKQETLQVRLARPEGDAFYVISGKRFDSALHWTIDVSPVKGPEP